MPIGHSIIRAARHNQQPTTNRAPHGQYFAQNGQNCLFSYKNGHIAIWEDRTLQTDRQAVIIFRDTHFTGEDKTGGTN